MAVAVYPFAFIFIAVKSLADAESLNQVVFKIAVVYFSGFTGELAESVKLVFAPFTFVPVSVLPLYASHAVAFAFFEIAVIQVPVVAVLNTRSVRESVHKLRFK